MSQSHSTDLHDASQVWTVHMREAIRSIDALERFLNLKVGSLGDQKRAVDSFPLFVPIPFARRIESGNPSDPLLLQVLPTESESSSPSHFQNDAVSDLGNRIAPGVISKYQGRALLITTGTCAVHCRYCFRREYPYGEEPRSMEAWNAGIEAISKDDSISEVILSGGDPLTLNDSRLSALVKLIESVPHVQRLRIHTRLPIMIPSRINSAFYDLLAGSRLSTVVVIHMNHAQEWDDEVELAVNKIQTTGTPVLNQAVLLRNINDTVDDQLALCESLINRGVIPYYINQLDQVRGAAHFEVPIAEGIRIVDELRSRLPGYAVPRYVQDLGGASKSEITGI